MKKVALTLLILIIVISCKKNSNDELVGTWELIEIFSDPGDGSGSYNSVESDKTITFKNNGKLISNGSLCEVSKVSDGKTTGRYSEANSTFTSSDCLDPDYEYTFVRDGNILIITYPCIEGCGAKYQKQ